MAHQFFRLLGSASETVYNAAFTTLAPAAIFPKSFLLEDLDKVGMRSARMEEQRKVKCLGK